MARQLYMVVEHFKDAPGIYRRFAERGHASLPPAAAQNCEAIGAKGRVLVIDKL